MKEEVYDEDFNLFKVIVNDRYGFIDKSGEIIIEPQFDNASTFSEGLASVSRNGKLCFIDKNGNIIIETDYEASIWGDMELINADVLFKEGLARVQVGNLFGFIDKKGEMVIQPQFILVRDFAEGLAAVSVEGKLGFIDKEGKYVIQPNYPQDLISSSDFSERLAAVCDDTGLWGYVNKEGNYVIKPDYELAFPFSEGLAKVSVGLNFGYIDLTGELVIPPIFDFNIFPSFFKDGFAPVQKAGKWGYINKTGKFVIEPQFEEAYGFVDGLAPAKEKGLWGYIDKTGEFKIPPSFNSAFPFENGLALVELNGTWGCYIDSNGLLVWSPEKKAQLATNKSVEAFLNDPIINLLQKSFTVVKQILGEPTKEGYRGRDGGINCLYYEKEDILFISPYYGVSTMGNEIVTSIEIGKGNKIMGAEVGMTFSEIKAFLGSPDSAPRYDSLVTQEYVVGYSFGKRKSEDSDPEFLMLFFAKKEDGPTHKALAMWKMIDEDVCIVDEYDEYDEYEDNSATKPPEKVELSEVAIKVLSNVNMQRELTIICFDKFREFEKIYPPSNHSNCGMLNGFKGSTMDILADAGEKILMFDRILNQSDLNTWKDERVRDFIEGTLVLIALKGYYMEMVIEGCYRGDKACLDEAKLALDFIDAGHKELDSMFK